MALRPSEQEGQLSQNGRVPCVLLCIPTMQGGGAERQLAYLAAELIRVGVEVHVAVHPTGTHLESLQRSGAKIHYFRVSSNYSPAIFIQLCRIARRTRADLIQTYLVQMDVLGCLCAKALGLPWILTERSSASPYRVIRRNGIKWGMGHWTDALRMRLGGYAAAIVANSQGGLDYWRPHSRDARLYIVPNGIPCAETDRPSAATLKEIGLHPDERFILSAGRFDEGKNPKLLVDALARVAQQLSVRSVICGTGPLWEGLRAEIAARGLQDVIKLPGYVARVDQLMRQARLFVSASHFEGCPNAVLEAMVAGCPVVVSDIGGHREILDEHSCEFIDPRHADDIVRGLLKALKEEELTASRVTVAKTRAARFSVEMMAQRYLAIYRDLIPSAFGHAPADAEFEDASRFSPSPLA